MFGFHFYDKNHVFFVDKQTVIFKGCFTFVLNQIDKIMLKRGTKLYSIFKFRCPACHEGDFFVSKNPYNLSKAGDLHKECPQCGQKYSKEPGFYYGAMYVSYGIGVAVFVSIWVAISVLFPNAPTSWYLWAIGAAIVLGTPYFYALSKIIWANLFFKYDCSKDPKCEVGKKQLQH